MTTRFPTHLRTIALLAAAALSACASDPKTSSNSGKPVTQLSFASPEEAVAALTYAAEAGDAQYSRSLFGPEASDLSSGDPAVDQYEKQAFAAAIRRKTELSRNADGTVDILVGEQAVPFPVPLVEYGHRWLFDTPAGVDRLTDIRVGFHELKTLESLAAIEQAQLDYWSRDVDGNGVQDYARRFRSTQGKRDGLYWPTRPGEPSAPLGEYFEQADAPVSQTQGYYGYFYKILTGQGAGAPGGARSYLDPSGRLVGGFAILAYPAVYGETAIMTFQMGSDGVIYQKDLGPGATPTAGETITAYDVSDGWTVASE